MLFLQLNLLKLWSHQISWGTSSCDPVTSHKLNRLGQLKLRCCHISSAKEVLDESVLEQETCNEQVGFRGHSSCDTCVTSSDVPTSFSLWKHWSQAETLVCQYFILLKYGVTKKGWNWGLSSDSNTNRDWIFFIFFSLPASVLWVSWKQSRGEPNLKRRWVLFKSC